MSRLGRVFPQAIMFHLTSTCRGNKVRHVWTRGGAAGHVMSAAGHVMSAAGHVMSAAGHAVVQLERARHLGCGGRGVSVCGGGGGQQRVGLASLLGESVLERDRYHGDSG